MHLMRWRLRGAACVAAILVASMSMGIEPVQVDLGKVSEPGLRGAFSQVEIGTKAIDGVPFALTDTRVSVKPGKKQRIDFAPTVCAGIHFLHYTEQGGDRHGSYTLIYGNGSTFELPIQGGFNINDWWKPGALIFAGMAHSDVLKMGEKQQSVGFWRFSAKNPHPELPLTAIEVVNADAVVTINLIAVTLTGTCEDKIGNTPVWINGMDEEQFAIALLNQQGEVIGKEKACEQLRRSGTIKSVPVLTGYLTDEKLSPAARLALAAMPYPEARKALRDALAKTTGTNKAGIIETLGTLRDPKDVSLIAPSLRDSNPVIAMSSALALGRIGGTEAVKTLKAVAGESTGRLQMVIMNSLLQCAEGLCGKDDTAANALYTDIYKQFTQSYVGTAAYRGMIRTAGKKTPELISNALTGTDPVLWDAAITAVRELKTPELTPVCADLLPRAAKPVLAGFIEALAQRGDKAIAPALAPMVGEADPAISMSAIKAMAVVGDATSVAPLVKAAAHSEDPNRTLAMQSLGQLNTGNVTAALLTCLKGADASETTVLTKVMGQRKDESAGPALRELVQGPDAGIRTAAVQALAEIGVATDTELLCQVMERAENDKERATAKRALIVLGKRLNTPAEQVNSMLASLNKDNPALRCALLGVCGKLKNADLLQALNKATGDANAEVKDAAITALADADNPEALPCLLALLDTTKDLTHRVLIFRGIARLGADDKALDEKVREAALIKALAVAERPEEKKLFLGALGGCPTMGALKTVEAQLPSKEVVAEAVIAWGQIAKPLLATNGNEIREATPRVVARGKEAGLSKEALRSVQEVVRALAASPVTADKVRFEHIVLDKQFRSEGVAVTDVNRDGVNDIIAGEFWFEGPTWKVHEIRPTQSYDPNTGYSQCFINFAADVDEDGWTDSIVFGFPGAPVHWYRNPGEEKGPWQEHLLATAAQSETPLFGDLLGDKKPVLLFGMNNRATWFRTGQDKRAPWMVYPISHQMDFAHGLGMGDLNKDGRMDVLFPEGWWEGPVDRMRPDWGFHPAHFSTTCANMLVYDVDGDNDNDVISSSAHNYGIWWAEQVQKDGAMTFVQHEIDKSISQTHALILADINNDGLQDLVTGKRYYAHCGHDPGCHEPAVLCWFELKRPAPGKVEYIKHEIDNDSGVGTQFEVCDLDGDGLQDIVTSNKKGIHVFLQRRNK